MTPGAHVGGTILADLGDQALLGALPAFRDLTTWRAWLVFLRALYGLPMDAEDRAVFQRHTRRTEPRPGGYPESVVITGRQSGKSAIAAAVGTFEAATSTQRGTFALLIAQDERNARRTLFRAAVEPFQCVPMFAREVSKATDDTLELANGVSLAVYPARPASVRGIRACVAIVDELAYLISTEGRPMDREMLRAVRPCLATTGGKLLILSSPYAASGALWDLHRQHFARDASPVLVWQASAPEMNPTLPADYLQRMREDDPEAYRSEVEGEFRAGVASLFDSEALDAVTDQGIAERLAEPGIKYAAHFDASGGRADAAALAVAHRAGDAVMLDCLRRWPSPHNPEAVIAEAADVLRSFSVWRVQIDKFGAEYPVRAFERHRVRAETSRRSTAEHYLALLPFVNAARVRLLDRADLGRELRGLERRRGTGGKDTVSHPRGGHDDTAAAVAGVVALLGSGRDPDDRGITFGSGASF